MVNPIVVFGLSPIPIGGAFTPCQPAQSTGNTAPGRTQTLITNLALTFTPFYSVQVGAVWLGMEPN